MVSQGSILASVSFNIFINDSKAKVGSMLIIFVDKYGAESNKNILEVQERLNGRVCVYLINIEYGRRLITMTEDSGYDCPINNKKYLY